MVEIITCILFLLAGFSITLFVCHCIRVNLEWNESQQRYQCREETWEQYLKKEGWLIFPQLEDIPPAPTHKPVSRGILKAAQPDLDNWEERFAPFDPAKKAVIRATPKALTPDLVDPIHAFIDRQLAGYLADQYSSLDPANRGTFEYLHQRGQLPSTGAPPGDHHLAPGSSATSRDPQIEAIDYFIHEAKQKGDWIRAQYLTDHKARMTRPHEWRYR